MTEPLRIAIAGTGHVFPLYRRALARLPGLALAAVIHPRQSAVPGLDVPVFPNLAALFAGGPETDAVVVLSPAEFHVDHALTALNHGRHVLVEKPVALDLAGIDRLIAAATVAGRVCAPAHTYAYDLAVVDADALLAAGDLGRVRFAQARYLKVHSEAMSRRFPSVLQQHAIHLQYLLLRYLGRPAWVDAHLDRLRYTTPTLADLALLTLSYPDGAVSQVTVSIGVGDLRCPTGSYAIELFGEHGTYVHGWQEGYAETPDEVTLSTAYLLTFERLLAAFVRACAGEDALRSTLADARAAECIHLAAIAAHEAGHAVAIDYR